MIHIDSITGISYTIFFKSLKRKESRGLKSGLLGDHGIRPARLKNNFRCILWDGFFTFFSYSSFAVYTFSLLW